jgi:hypothetical protein
MVYDNHRFSYIRDIGTPILYWRSRSGIILRADELLPQALQQQAKSPSEGSPNSNWTPEARSILDIGAQEIHKSNLQGVERLTIYAELNKLCAGFSQYRDVFNIRQKILELSKHVSDPNLTGILLHMYEESGK